MAANPNKLNIKWPGFTQDTIIYADTWRGSIANTTFTTLSAPLDLTYSGNPTYGLPVGIYSLDDGTWYDANGQDGPLLIEVDSNSNGTAQFNETISSTLVPGYASGALVPYTFKFAILSINGTEKLNKPIQGGKLTAYQTGVNYSKVHLSGEVSRSSQQTIDHNLGYVPQVRVWIRYASGQIGPARPAGIIGAGIRVNETQLVLNALPGADGSYIYRIYKDA